MKKRIMIPILLLILLLTFNITAFAGEIIGDQNNNSTSDSRLKIWDEYYPYRIMKDGKPLYLFDMQEKNMDNAIMYLKLGDFFGGERPFLRGQFVYLPINNEGNPRNLDILMNANNFEKLYGIPRNNVNGVGRSYFEKSGRSYLTEYPSGHPLAGQKNWNFKSSTRTKNVYDNPPNTDMHFFRHTTGITGNIRFVYDLNGIQVGFYAFSPDAINGDEGFLINEKNVLKDPWNQMSTAVQKGHFNIIWDRDKDVLKTDFDTDGNRKMIERLNVLSMEQYRPDFKAKLAELTKRTYKDLDINDDFKNVWYRVDTMYKYFSVHNRGGHGYGSFMLVHQGSSQKWYYTFSSPRLYINKDLAFGGAKFNSGKIEYFPLAGDEKYDFKIYDAETGEAIPEEGTMIVGKKYVARFFVGFQKLGHDVLQSYHSNIKTYIDIDLFTKGQTISPNKTFSEKALEGFIIGKKGTSVGHLKPYNNSGGSDKIDNPNELVEYEYEFTLPPVNKDGETYNRMRVYAGIADESEYYKGDKSPEQDDNGYADNNYTWSFYNIEKNPEDIFVAHKENGVTPNVIAETGSNYTNAKITKVNGSNYNSGVKIKPSDKLDLEIYVQRIKEATSKEPITLGQVQLYTKEKINPTETNMSKYIGHSYLPSYYYKGSKIPQLVKYKEYNPETKTYTEYDFSPSDFSKPLKAGTILIYELKDYVVPSMTEIKESTNKWATNIDGIYNKGSIEKISLTFDMELKNLNPAEVNNVAGNDWARLDFDILPSDQRNMKIHQVKLFDENGTLVETINDIGTATRNVKINSPLDATKNYYVEIQTQFIFPFENKTSINQDLKMANVVSFNGIPQADASDVKYRASSNLTGFWKDGDIGTYKLKSATNIKNYNPKTSTFDPLVIPLKHTTNANSGQVWMKIPDMYDNTDNRNLHDWGLLTIDFVVNDSGSKDNAVESIELFSGSTKYTPSKLDINPNKIYYSLIKIKRLSGASKEMEDINPRLKVSYYTDKSTKKVVYLYPHSSSSKKDLKAVGDTITYRLDNLITSEQYIKIKAELEIPDTDMSNNIDSETWFTDYNFYVTDMVVSPTTIGMNKNDYSIQRDIAISAIAGFTNTTNTPTANAVPITIERYSKPIGQDWKYDGIVYNKNHNLSDGSNVTIQHTDKNVSFGRNEVKQYVVKINGGKSGVQKYTQETRRDDNEMFEEVKSIWKPDNPNPTDFVCKNGNHLKNTWNTEFSYRKVHSGVPRKQWIPPYSYTTGDPPYTVNVAGYWHYYCDPSPTHDPYKYETRTFTEEFGVKAVMFKTSDDPVERNILTSSKNTVRAGQSFDLYVVVEYKTNRDQMPWGHLPVGSGFQYLNSPSPIDGWTCNYERRNPNYSMVTSIPDIRFEFKGGDMHIYYNSLAPKIKTGNATRTFKYFPLGETTYIPKDAKDMVFNIRINTKDFQGYYADVNHPRIPLCQSISTQVEVKGPMPISTGQVQIEGID